MIWKTFIFAFLALGVLAEYEITDEQRNQLKSMLTQYCKKNGAEEKATDVETGVRNFLDCVKNLINPDQIKKEIEDAKPNGALDEVFKKYCAKSPELKTCMHTAFNALSPCLDQSTRDYLPALTNATDQLLDFVCYKDGDRIALFIAEGGPECFQEKVNPIRDCVMKIRSDVTTVEEAKKLTLPEQCAKFDEMSTCVVSKLEECSTPTPGNMAEALFKFIRKGTPCQKS